jgi:hypothetical protein
LALAQKMKNQISRNNGIDMFVLLGDPNAANTTAGMTVKLTKPN